MPPTIQKRELFEYKCRYPKLGGSWHLRDQNTCERMAIARAYATTTRAWSAHHTNNNNTNNNTNTNTNNTNTNKLFRGLLGNISFLNPNEIISMVYSTRAY